MDFFKTSLYLFGLLTLSDAWQSHDRTRIKIDYGLLARDPWKCVQRLNELYYRGLLPRVGVHIKPVCKSGNSNRIRQLVRKGHRHYHLQRLDFNELARDGRRCVGFLRHMAGQSLIRASINEIKEACNSGYASWIRKLVQRSDKIHGRTKHKKVEDEDEDDDDKDNGNEECVEKLMEEVEEGEFPNTKRSDVEDVCARAKGNENIARRLLNEGGSKTGNGNHIGPKSCMVWHLSHWDNECFDQGPLDDSAHTNHHKTYEEH